MWCDILDRPRGKEAGRLIGAIILSAVSAVRVKIPWSYMSETAPRRANAASPTHEMPEPLVPIGPIHRHRRAKNGFTTTRHTADSAIAANSAVQQIDLHDTPYVSYYGAS